MARPAVPRTRRTLSSDAARWVAAPSGKPQWYGPLARVSDWLQGNRDGRRGLPVVGSGTVVTPTLRAHGTYFSGGHHDEWQQAERDVTPNRQKVERLAAESDACRAEIERRLAILSTLPERLPQERADERRAGEADADILVVRRRRDREHAARRDREQAVLDAARARIDQLETEQRATAEEIDRRFVVAAIRVGRMHAHCERRIAVYQRRLLRAHPEADRLAELLAAAHPQLPAWATTRVPALTGGSR
jgi:hypothetical protein